MILKNSSDKEIHVSFLSTDPRNKRSMAITINPNSINHVDERKVDEAINHFSTGITFDSKGINNEESNTDKHAHNEFMQCQIYR